MAVSQIRNYTYSIYSLARESMKHCATTIYIQKAGTAVCRVQRHHRAISHLFTVRTLSTNVFPPMPNKIVSRSSFTYLTSQEKANRGSLNISFETCLTPCLYKGERFFFSTFIASFLFALKSKAQTLKGMAKVYHHQHSYKLWTFDIHNL